MDRRGGGVRKSSNQRVQVRTPTAHGRHDLAELPLEAFELRSDEDIEEVRGEQLHREAGVPQARGGHQQTLGGPDRADASGIERVSCFSSSPRRTMR